MSFAAMVTPMLDMAFQLLAFFVMTYEPYTLMEGHFEGALLPLKKEDLGGSTTPQLPAKDEPPEIDESVTVYVEAIPKGGQPIEFKDEDKEDKTDGMPTKIYVKFPESLDKELVADEEDSVDTAMKNLQKALKDYMKTVDKGDTKEEEDDEEIVDYKLNIEADDSLMHQYFILVFDVCKSANFNRVSFAQPPGLREASTIKKK